MNNEVNNVSTRDVAAAAGVSATLVSWVAKGTATQHRIPEKTQRRVRVAMEQLGYRPAGPGPAGPAVVGCSVDKLLSERSAESLSSTTKQPDNLTTLLSSSGYRLVTVQSTADLAVAMTEGLVGLVYRERENRPSTEDQDPGLRLKLPVTPPAETLSLDSRSNANGLRSEVVTPVFEATPSVPPVSQASSVSEVAADVTTLRSSVPSLRSRVSAADAASEVQPGTNAAGPSTSLRAGTSASTLAAEPEIEIPAPTAEAPTPTYAPVSPSSPSATEQPNNLTTAPQAPSVSEVAADVPAAEAASEIQPGTYAAGTPASTLAAEPEIEILAPTAETPTPTYAPVLPASPSATEQPNNLTTAPQAPSVSEVAAGVSAAEAASVIQPGTNAAGPSTPLRAGTSASTLAAEPEIEIPAPTPETPAPTYERVSEVAAGVSAAEAASEIQPGTNAAGTPASTFAAEPEIEILAPTAEAPTPTYERVSEVAAGVSAAEAASVIQPGTNAAGPSTPLRAGTPASTLTAEPETAPTPVV